MNSDPAEMIETAFELARQKRFDEALGVCDKVLLNKPSDVVGHYAKFMVLQRMGKRDVAKKSLNRALRIAPDLAFLYFTRAQLSMESQDFEKALPDLNKAESLDEGSFEPMIRLLRAECYLELGDHEAARQDCDQLPDRFSFPASRWHRSETSSDGCVKRT